MEAETSPLAHSLEALNPTISRPSAALKLALILLTVSVDVPLILQDTSSPGITWVGVHSTSKVPSKAITLHGIIIINVININSFNLLILLPPKH